MSQSGRFNEAALLTPAPPARGTHPFPGVAEIASLPHSDLPRTAPEQPWIILQIQAGVRSSCLVRVWKLDDSRTCYLGREWIADSSGPLRTLILRSATEWAVTQLLRDLSSIPPTTELTIPVAETSAIVNRLMSYSLSPIPPTGGFDGRIRILSFQSGMSRLDLGWWQDAPPGHELLDSVWQALGDQFISSSNP